MSSGSGIEAGRVFSGGDTGYDFITIEDQRFGSSTGNIIVYQNQIQVIQFGGGREVQLIIQL